MVPEGGTWVAGVQVTTLLHRAGLGRGAPSDALGDGAPSDTLGDGAPSDALDDEAPSDPLGDVAPSGLLRRAVAATGQPEAAGVLADLWRTLDPATRAAVVDPVGELGRAGRQGDRTTCGSAVLTMLAALGDPFLAVWLASGQVPGVGLRPPELARASPSALDLLADAPAERRFTAVHRVLKTRTGARAVLGVLPWPAALGTPPWTAAREARHAPLRYRAVLVDDTDADRTTRVLDHVGAAVRAGVAVPLYTGGDSSTGWSTALPRHVVLAVGATTGTRSGAEPTDRSADRAGRPNARVPAAADVEDGLAIWEPASGRRFEVSRASLLAPTGPSPALGGWTHLDWAVLPVG